MLPDRLLGTELSQDEFRDSLRLWYGLVPLDLPPIAMAVVNCSRLTTP